jgi:hypothetical protein
MGDLAEIYREMDKHQRERREARLASADNTGWTVHTTYHWSRDLNGERLDYWPSRSKFQYQGKVLTGEVDKFIAKRTKK